MNISRFLLNPIYNYQWLNKSAKYFFKEITPKLYQPSTKPKRPEQLYLETTNICTADCIFCAYSKQSRPSGVMSDEIFKQALQQYAAMGGLMVAFTPMVGEPLVDPKIIDRISFAYNMKIFRHIHMVSNGNLLLKNDIYRSLINCGLNSISFSIPEFNEEGYHLMFRNNAYQQTVEGIHKLLSYHKQVRSPTKIIIAFKARKPLKDILNDSDYIQCIAPFVDKRTVFYEYTTDYDSWGGLITEKEMIADMKIKPRYVNNFPCWRTYETTILWNGDVRICPCRFNPAMSEDELHIGNITKTTLKQLFQSEKSISIRRSFLRGQPPALCANCQLYSAKPFLSQWLSIFSK